MALKEEQLFPGGGKEPRRGKPSLDREPRRGWSRGRAPLQRGPDCIWSGWGLAGKRGGLGVIPSPALAGVGTWSVASHSCPSAWPSENQGWNGSDLPHGPVTGIDRVSQVACGAQCLAQRERAQTTSAFTVMTIVGLLSVSSGWGAEGSGGTALAARGPPGSSWKSPREQHRGLDPGSVVKWRWQDQRAEASKATM